MPKICLIILIGIPGAGKTTFCKNLALQLDKKEFQLYVVSYDDIRNDGNLKRYKEFRNIAQMTAKEKIQLITKEKSTFKHLVIIDDNMYYKSMRYEYYKLARQYEISFLEVYFDVNLEIALERNRNREQPALIDEHVITNMYNKLEKPQQWEQNHIFINSNIDSIRNQLFLDKLSKSFDTPLKNIVVEKIKIKPSKLHVADLLLRKIVHQKLQTNVQHSIKYTNVKNSVYKDIKNGILHIENLDENELGSFLEQFFLIDNL